MLILGIQCLINSLLIVLQIIIGYRTLLKQSVYIMLVTRYKQLKTYVKKYLDKGG